MRPAAACSSLSEPLLMRPMNMEEDEDERGGGGGSISALIIKEVNRTDIMQMFILYLTPLERAVDPEAAAHSAVVLPGWRTLGLWL